MTDKLRVRLYNIRFGDAVLVSVPDNGTTRHILIDVGNVLAGEGGFDAVFKPVIEDIKAELGGKPLDLYVMTHEHMDHIQGLPFAKEKANLELDVDFAWITASAKPDYYETHPNAKKKKLEALAAYEEIAAYLQAEPDKTLEGLMLNNNPRSTADCVTYLRGLANQTTFVHRETDIDGTHPFEEATFEIWGPEEDTSSYYRSFQPLALGVNGGGAAGAEPTVVNPLPPAGVDAGAFYNLVDSRRSGLHDNLLAIDKAANNTSIVFSLEWRLEAPVPGRRRAGELEDDGRAGRARARPRAQDRAPRKLERDAAGRDPGQDPAPDPARQPQALRGCVDVPQHLQRRARHGHARRARRPCRAPLDPRPDPRRGPHRHRARWLIQFSSWSAITSRS